MSENTPESTAVNSTADALTNDPPIYTTAAAQEQSSEAKISKSAPGEAVTEVECSASSAQTKDIPVENVADTPTDVTATGIEAAVPTLTADTPIPTVETATFTVEAPTPTAETPTLIVEAPAATVEIPAPTIETPNPTDETPKPTPSTSLDADLISSGSESTKAISSTSKVEEESTASVQPTAPSPTDSVATDDTYAEHVTYEADGSAIYTDPKTHYRYKWCTTANTWLPCSSDTNSADNPYENEHYKWCSETQQWIPKQTQQATETEHYKWDAEKREWLPKVTTAAAPTVATVEAVTKTSTADGVTYSIDEDGQRIYTDKDGTVYFWEANKNAWFPKIDDDFMARYQMNYGFIDNTSAAEEEKRKREEEEAKLKELQLQRMTEEAKAAEAAAAEDSTECGAAAAGLKRKAAEPPKWFDPDPAQNTKVYVWNLPLDITLDEFAEVMGKCGMIMRDPQTQKYKLKLYAEPDGQLKGDGLCDYIKVESVDLALKILDEYNLRDHKIRVQRAQFQMRGEYNPALKPKRKKKDKEKLQKMKERLFDWRPEKMRGERSKNEKVVILKNLFEPSLFEKEVQLILDYQNDLREECSKCGTVRKVVIYDRHPEGVAQINMSAPEEADQVIQMMQGRYFGKRQLTAEHWDGKTKYKVAESETEVQKRLTNWDQYLESEAEKKAGEKQQTSLIPETPITTQEATESTQIADGGNAPTAGTNTTNVNVDVDVDSVTNEVSN